MKFYIASSFRNKKAVQELSARLTQHGGIHTYDWTQINRADTFEILREVGIRERNGVADSDLVLVMLPGGKGTHIELGMAIALGKRIILFDPEGEVMDLAATSTFYHLPGIEIFTGSTDGLIKMVLDSFHFTIGGR